MDQTSDPAGTRSVSSSPVDDVTYNVLQALTSTLESIEAYEKYRTQAGGLFDRMLQDEQEHARLLLAELRSRLAASS